MSNKSNSSPSLYCQPGGEQQVSDLLAVSSKAHGQQAVVAEEHRKPSCQRARPLALVERAAVILLATSAAASCTQTSPPDQLLVAQTLSLPRSHLKRSLPWDAWIRDEASQAPVTQGESRGFGTMTARVPGTNNVVSGVRLVSHQVQAMVRDGFARTTIEEEFQNDTNRVLEGRYVFPLPPDATISRLALYVGDTLVEGEIVERPRAARIFKGIVDDTVRPRDPALLEWTHGSEFSLKIFPIDPKGKRKVILAYDQALPEVKGRVRYVYPMSLGADRTTTIDNFSLAVTAMEAGALISSVQTPNQTASIRADESTAFVSHQATSFAPKADFVVTYAKKADDDLVMATYWPTPNEFQAVQKGQPSSEPDANGFCAFRIAAELPDGTLPQPVRRDRAIVLDVSHSQSKDTLDAQAKVATEILQAMDPDERFVLLACDSDCMSYPEDGLVAVTDSSISGAKAWLQQRSPRGSSDLAGAVFMAAKRLEPNGAGQVIYMGDGVPSSGELRLSSMVARIAPALQRQNAELRVFGLGRTLDEDILAGLARAVGGTYDRVITGEPLARRAKQVAMELRAPVIRDPKLVLPDGVEQVYPKTLPNLRLGQEIVAVGRMTRDINTTTSTTNGEVIPAVHHPSSATDTTQPKVMLTGILGGKAYTIEKQTRWITGKEQENPLIPRLWARAKIAELEVSKDAESTKEAIRLAQAYHVMSRETSLLVLENDRMFAEFGIRRTTQKAEEQSDHAFGQDNDKGIAAPSPLASTAQPSAEFGMLGLLSKPADSPDAPTTPWTREKSSDPLSAKGNMWGDSSGSNVGLGGLGLSGIGEGGGGRGEGIGLGNVGTIGRGAGVGTGQGFGSGHGRLGGSHQSKPPQVRMGASTVSGRLPPEVIQRIVRQNFGRFRLCYENGLRNNPNLQGRVAIRFVIGRDGAVTNVANGGSDMPDSGVVACIVQSFNGLVFPQPEGGIVTVVYPINFSPGGGSMASTSSSSSSPQTTPPSSWKPRPVLPLWTGPTAVHRTENISASAQAEKVLAKLRADVEQEGASRQKYESLIRKLLANGHFDEALKNANRFAELDPDLDTARELLAFAGAANGEAFVALGAVDSLTELSPGNATRHLRAARAFEASGEERRACAHWRALADLEPDDASMYQAMRCRARIWGEREAVLTELKAKSHQGPEVKKLAETLQSGSAPAFDAGDASQGRFVAQVKCPAEVANCPTVAVVSPQGTVISPWTPGSGRSDKGTIAFFGLVNGTYRTVIAGGAPGVTAEIRTLGVKKTFSVSEVGVRTLALTTVSRVD